MPRPLSCKNREIILQSNKIRNNLFSSSFFLNCDACVAVYYSLLKVPFLIFLRIKVAAQNAKQYVKYEQKFGHKTRFNALMQTRLDTKNASLTNYSAVTRR